ncbi:MAG TPA: hypothetical protein VEU96_14890 [Bryobacteraceae bacterium]|nr:hypothetical protein [Bryobacteraceae bacterium]
MDTLTEQTVDFPTLDPSWLRAPSEDTPGFADAFIIVSAALQTALRKHLPAAYLENLEHFRDVQTAYAVLVYQASRVYRGTMRTDLTRDVMNPQTMALLVRMSKRNLIRGLGGVEARLRDAGLGELAEQYSRKRLRYIMKAVQRLRRSRRCLGILVRGESVLLNALAELGGLGELSARGQVKKVARLKKKWTGQLRHLYPEGDFRNFATILLDAATQALQKYLETAPSPNSSGDPADTSGGEPRPGSL